MKIYRSGIIGCGRIGSLFDENKDLRKIHKWSTHARMYNDFSKTKLVCASEKNSKLSKKFQKRWGVKVYKNYFDMLDQEKLDIISICTNVNSHFKVLKKLIDKKIKIIFCEKPFVENLTQAKKIIKLSKENETLISINHRRRWEESYNKLKKEIIFNKRIGKIQSITAYYSGGISNTGSHLIDLMIYLFGNIKEVSAFSRSRKKDPELNCFINFKNNIECNLIPINNKKLMIFDLIIFGTNGKVEIKNNGHEFIYYKKDENKIYSGSKIYKKKQIIKYNKLSNQFFNAISNLVSVYEKKNKKILSNIYDATKVLNVTLGLLYSAKNKSIKISIPFKMNERMKIFSK